MKLLFRKRQDWTAEKYQTKQACKNYVSIGADKCMWLTATNLKMRQLCVTYFLLRVFIRLFFFRDSIR